MKLFKATGSIVWQLAFGWLPLFLPRTLSARLSVLRHSRRPLSKKRKLPGFIQLFWPYSAASLVIVVAGLCGAGYFSLQAATANKLEPVTSFSIPAPAAKKTETVKKGLPASEPTQLRITRVGIDTKIISVGQLPDGTMETPPLFDPVAGWYKFSPTPGEIGPAVIVGHIDTYKGPSVFWHLKDLQAGDVVEVTRADGTVIKFKVEALKQFEQNNFPTEEVYGNLDHAGLRLITCGGSFNHKTGHYSDNTVVYASMIDDPSLN